MCDDGSACTGVDTCLLGTCFGSGPVMCFASDQCHDAGTCDPLTGMCSDPVRMDNSICDDGDVCTSPDVCTGGACGGAACSGCTNLAAQQTTYDTATRAQFFTDNAGATVISLDLRANGDTPVAGTTFDPDELAALGVRISLVTADATANLIWAGNAVSGFGVRLTCSNPTTCQGDIVVEFAAPKRAAGFDYPGNVQGVWRQPDATLIYDSGNVAGSGDNFLGLTSIARIGSVTLIRSGVNQLSGLAFADCASTCGPGGELCF